MYLPRNASGIYFLWYDTCPQFIKIGRAKNIQHRLVSYRTHSPFDLSLLFIPKGNGKESKAVEERWHEMFNAHRYEGEWFYSKDEDVGIPVSAIAELLDLPIWHFARSEGLPQEPTYHKRKGAADWKAERQAQKKARTRFYDELRAKREHHKLTYVKPPTIYL